VNTSRQNDLCESVAHSDETEGDSRMILSGDIGGMKTNVAIFEADGRKLSAAFVQRGFPSAEYESPDAIVEDFVAG
jgi:glucokinase